MSVQISFIKRKSFRERVWKSLSVVVGISTILNVSMVLSLMQPGIAQAQTTNSTLVCSNNENVNIDQWADVAPASWQNGNLNGNNSAYHEGESVPFKVVLSGTSSNTSYKVRIRYDFLKDTQHAYDYLTTVDRSRTPSGLPVGGENTIAIPTDATLPFTQAAGHFTLWGGSFGTISGPTASGNEKYYQVTVNASSSTVTLAWSGHLASSHNWGAGNGAGSISGSPFHMAISKIDCTSGQESSSQDRSIQPGAILPPPPAVINPPLGQSCGLDIGLVIDRSGSVDSTEMGQMKTALKNFVDAFAGTPTQFSVTKFSTTASVVQNFSTDLAATKNTIDAVSTSSGTTNWEDGLAKSFSTFDPRTEKSNLIVIATDGSPNTYNTNSGTSFDWTTGLSKAVTEANSIKSAAGTTKSRIVALGIGSDPSDPDYPNTLPKLEAISGSTVATTPAAITIDTDVIKVTDFAGIGDALASYAKALCGGKILVQKQFDTNGDGQADVTANDPLLSGWTFDVNGTNSNPVAQTTTNTGALQFDNILNGNDYSVVESARDGYKLVSAQCLNGTDVVGSVDLKTGTVSGLPMATDDTISCTFVNGYSHGEVTFEKVVRNFSQFADLSDFHFAVDGQGDYQNGDHDSFPIGQYTVTENAVDHYTLVGASGICSYDAKTKAISMNVGAQGGTCTIINDRNLGKVTVVKHVVGGNADPKDWRFHAANVLGMTSGDSFEVPVGDYPIGEYDGPAGYTLTAMSGACSLGTSANQLYSFQGQQGVVHVTEGETICDVTNTRDTGTITVNKLIDNQVNPAGWYWGFQGGEQHIAMGTQKTLGTSSYTITEEQQSNYHNVSWSCNNDATGTGESISVKLNKGQDLVCWFTNAHDVASISGHKWVDVNGNGVQDKDEPFKSGVDIWLSNGAHTTTDANGAYHFDNLPTGVDYTVAEVVPDGWVNTTPDAVTVHLTTQGATVDFGNFQLGKIWGHKYDNHEKTLRDWEICVSSASLPGDSCTSTNDNGYYELTGLPAGTYTVYEFQQAGWEAVSPDQGVYHDVVVTSGFNHRYDFVNRQLLPDLTVTKDDGQTTRTPGETYTYAIVVTNQGEFDATDVAAVDTLPAHMSYVSSLVDGTTASPTVSGSTITWDLGTMAKNASHTIALTVKLDGVFPNGTTELNNAVVVSTESHESNTENNDAHDVDTVTAGSTIALTKTGPSTVSAGQNIVYTLAWSVDGNAPVTNAAITDSVPSNTSFVTATCGTTGGYCAMNAVSGTITWNLGTRNPGESGTVTMTVKAASPIANGTIVTNTGSFGTKEHDPVKSTVTTTIVSTPSLTITKTNDVIGYTNPGKTVTYTVTVTNAAAATDTAHNVGLTDVLPAGFTYTIGGGVTKSFALGDLAPGVSVVTTYSAVIAANQTAGIYTNTASAKGTNTTTVVATSNVDVRVPSVLGVTTTPSVTLTKTIDTSTTNPGKQLTYTVTISNPGDLDVTNVTLSDTLPKGFIFVDSGTSTKTWTIGTLKAHHQRIINYFVTVGSSVKAGSYLNTATLTSAELDPLTAQAKVTVKVPQVLGLATTGVSLRDGIIFAIGLILMAIGLGWTLSLRRRSHVGIIA